MPKHVIWQPLYPSIWRRYPRQSIYRWLPGKKEGIKADRFRLEWAWTERLARILKEAVLADNWPGVAVTAAQVGEKLSQVRLPERHKLGTPWVGSWEKLKNKT